MTCCMMATNHYLIGCWKATKKNLRVIPRVNANGYVNSHNMNMKTILLMQRSSWFGTLFGGFICANKIITIFNHECNMQAKSIKSCGATMVKVRLLLKKNFKKYKYMFNKSLLTIDLINCGSQNVRPHRTTQLGGGGGGGFLWLKVLSALKGIAARQVSMCTGPWVSFCSGNGLVPSSDNPR